jgi:hypothetical protein
VKSRVKRNRFWPSKAKIRKAVAEELGQLPTRVTLESDKPLLSCTINGVDMDEVFAPRSAPAPEPAAVRRPSPVPDLKPSRDGVRDREPSARVEPEPVTPIVGELDAPASPGSPREDRAGVARALNQMQGKNTLPGRPRLLMSGLPSTLYEVVDELLWESELRGQR